MHSNAKSLTDSKIKDGQGDRNSGRRDAISLRKLHGENGLCFALVDTFNVMAELRLKAEYGDYLAYACNSLKGHKMADLRWKVEKLDWQVVRAMIRAEETTRAERKLRRLDPTPTPFLDDVAKAASRLGIEESLVR